MRIAITPNLDSLWKCPGRSSPLFGNIKSLKRVRKPPQAIYPLTMKVTIEMYMECNCASLGNRRNASKFVLACVVDNGFAYVKRRKEGRNGKQWRGCVGIRNSCVNSNCPWLCVLWRVPKYTPSQISRGEVSRFHVAESTCPCPEKAGLVKGFCLLSERFSMLLLSLRNLTSPLVPRILPLSSYAAQDAPKSV